MDKLTNMANNLGDIGSITENLNPVEDITGQAEGLTSGLSDTAGQVTDQAEGLTNGVSDVAGQVTEQVEGSIGNLFG